MSSIKSSRSISNNVAANSHAICARINQSANAIEQRWQQLLVQLQIQHSAISYVSSKLWIESIADVADSGLAKASVSKEFNRPIYNSDLGVRATLLVYGNGLSDLIVVADKSIFDKAALVAIVNSLVCNGIVLEGNSTLQAQPLSVTDFDFFYAMPGFEAINTGVECVELSNLADINRLLAVLGYVLSVFELDNEKSVSFFQCDNTNRRSFDSKDKYRPLALNVNDQDGLYTLSTNVDVQMGVNSVKDSINELADSKVSILWDCNEAELTHEIMNWYYLPCLGPLTPLTFIITKNAHNTLSLLLMFNKQLFCHKLIKRMLCFLGRIASKAEEETACFLRHSGLLSACEEKIIAELGRNEIRLDKPISINERIFQLAKNQPERVALCYGDNQLTYRELDDKANQIAHALLEKSVVKGDHIGICLSRSFDMVVSMLAILKVGAVYVPIDPTYPLERIAFTCIDGNLKFLISELTEINQVEPARLIASESFFQDCRSYSTAPPAVANLSVDDAAYIIYTSGSTGKPKGVVIPHSNLSHLVNSTTDDFQFNNEDVWTLFHSTAFDFSVWEIWGCLLTGAKLVIVPYWTSRSVNEFINLLRDKKVTVLNQTPSAFVSLIKEEVSNPIGDNLRLVIFGGEALDTKALLPWLDRYPETQCRLINMYGITETTIHVTSENITRHHAVTASSSVGKALSGWDVYVLDDNQKMQPPGVSGEIYVGGVGVAIKYHNKTQLTSERFVENPFHRGIMYKSGDKGIMLEDGNLLHMGRLDDQIKLRGFRIELGEIRNTLLSLEGVTAAAVKFSQSDPTDQASARLDTYVMLERISIDDVIRHAKRYLPDHMQSVSYQQVSEMPLTPNGKLDLKRIDQMVIPVYKAKGISKSTKSRTHFEGDTEKKVNADASREKSIEQKLTEIWQEVLTQPVSAHDNFFDLGGNSLYAIRISTAMEKIGLSSIHLRDIYIHQTIHNLINCSNVITNRVVETITE
ncbi:amino acid adenylation domain-containing protein [Colwellia psychrerythraea]|uniref:Amino acid adenylation domain protein n=1 Tax=Colwellia psychrerythraea TaxID=28229 RepID=A0A099K8U1_COLPS|nr:amino acid adenylation domain-containing protein [Colwellia psychrerythraea]KGJ86786.1 amino acid adenylation domain protein [Colwellia psychrerythraea]